jgi:hypothetical protein
MSAHELLSRPGVCILTLAVAATALCGLQATASAADPLPVTERDGVRFVDAHDLGIEGQGWPAADFAAPFDRLPAKAQEKVRPDVWNLSRHAAGLCVRFVADTPAIHARWTLTSAQLAMKHMPATGVSGLDLYARDDAGQWRWVACGIPNADGQEQAGVVADGLSPGKREWLLYLPLYNGVSKVEIGVPAGATLEKAPAYVGNQEKPIVFYGTSITHGACASRPGMCHTAILHRRYGRPVVNLGFSGNGRMEPELGDLLAEIDAAAYVIDCCPNLDAAAITARTGPLVEILRKARPTTPILLVEDRRYTDSWIRPLKKAHNDANHAALRAAFDGLVAQGVTGLHSLGGDDLLAEDAEGTVDSSHPTDLGFVDHAKAFARVLDPLVR